MADLPQIKPTDKLKRIVPLGLPLPWSWQAAKSHATIRDADLNDARLLWRTFAPLPLATLLDAE